MYLQVTETLVCISFLFMIVLGVFKGTSLVTKCKMGTKPLQIQCSKGLNQWCGGGALAT